MHADRRCYGACKAGYSSFENICVEQCPAGYADKGVQCTKPTVTKREEYYIGSHCQLAYPAQGCECIEALWYPICPENYIGVGKLCEPTCPNGMKDKGHSCEKLSYAVVDVVSPLCKDGQENYGDKCYPVCEYGFEGSGPICWTGCPYQDAFDCGAICTNSKTLCENFIREDGKSSNIIDIIYASELLSTGASDVMKIVEDLQKIARDMDFGLCSALDSLEPSMLFLN